MLSNTLKRQKVFLEQLIGSKQRLNTKGPEDYNNNIRRLINKYNQAEDNYLSEEQLDCNNYTQNKCNNGKLNLDRLV